MRDQSVAAARHLAAFIAGRDQGASHDVIAGLDRMERTSAPIHIHVAEQTKEVDDCLAWSGGRRPVEYLLDKFDDIEPLVRAFMRPI